MIVVGDGIGQIGQLGFQSRLRACQKALADLAHLFGLLNGTMFEDALTSLKGEIQARELGITLFQ